MPKSTNESTEKKTRKKTKTTSKSKETSNIESTEKIKKASKSSKSSEPKKTIKTSKSKKELVAEKSSKSKKDSTEKKSTNKKTTKKKTSKKSTTSISKTRTRKSSKKEEILTSLEYYDLPYKYNETIVKILAQTPNTLFIYWDISDNDRKKLEETYGNNFFYNTKPVLIIHNETKNYSFEIDINDFANSWYLSISDSDCKYTIELGRRFINNNEQNIYNNINNYIYISSSNNLITPNDHILFNNNTNVQFKNLQNNTYFYKEISNMSLKELFEKLYSEEILKDLTINNPSSPTYKQ